MTKKVVRIDDEKAVLIDLAERRRDNELSPNCAARRSCGRSCLWREARRIGFALTGKFDDYVDLDKVVSRRNLCMTCEGRLFHAVAILPCPEEDTAKPPGRKGKPPVDESGAASG